MSKVSVDAGAYRLAINIMLRAAERHGEPTIAEAAHELRETAEVIDMTTRDELLEALEFIADIDISGADDRVIRFILVAAQDKARAAIAKAKGETK